MTWADLALFDTLSTWQERNASLFTGHAHLEKFLNMVKSNAHIKHWLETRPKTDF